MRKETLTKENKEFIKANYLKMGNKDLGKVCGCDQGVVSKYKRKNGLHVPIELSRLFAAKKRKGKTKATPEQDRFIKANYLKHAIKPLAKLMGIGQTLLRSRMKELSLVVPPALIQQRKNDSYIKPGTVPPNKGKKQSEFMSPEGIEKTAKTRFKKGGINHNDKYDGAISIRNEHPDRKGGRTVKYIRIAKGKWKELQIYNWEQKNGRLPSGHVLACKDGDLLNCDPDNWYPLSKADNAKRNAGHKNMRDGYVAGLIARNGKKVNQELKEELLQHPDLIEIKRQQLLLNKEIKNHEKRRN